MSLLEDVFLEDEAGEAQELERVIEGDEFDERPEPASGEDSNENSEKEDEAEEDKRRVEPTSTKTKRVSKNPRFVLNPARLMGPRGIQVIPDHFKDFKFKGKGHEKEDLDLVLKKLEHWAYRLYPKFPFQDCLKKIETLGKKRPVMVHLHKIRSDQYISDDVVVQNDSSDDESAKPPPEEDEFDRLLQQQIELARATPAPNSAKKGFATPRMDPTFSMPKATSSPSISDEQKERMLRNRRLAEERRLARLKNTHQNNISVINEVPIEVENHYNNSNDGTRNSSIENDVPIDVENPRKNVTVVNDVPFDVEDHYNNSNGGVTIENGVPIDVEIQNQRKNMTVVNDVPFNVENHYDNSNGTKNMTKENEVPIDVENHQNPKNNITVVNDVLFDVEYHTEHETRRKHKSNVIDSSDEDGDLVVNESITVDVHDTRTNDVTKSCEARSHKSNKIESSDQEAIENRSHDFDIRMKSNRSLIDSSDEEAEEIVVNQTVSVDIHHTRSDIGTSRPNEEIMTKDDSNSNAEIRITNEITTENVVSTDKIAIDDKINCEVSSTSYKDEFDNNKNNSETEKHDINENETVNRDSTQKSCNDNNIPEDIKSSSILPLNNKENIVNNIDLELMDVDFNDDF